VDDTTTVRRCGEAGLFRLRRDGARLERLLGAGGDPGSFLRRLNAEYREIRLTMGGVADCMAIVFALARDHAPAGTFRAGRDAASLAR
jgi:triphosphoribosyl-dephospho-CoA synthase